jgi:hypothetical protein
MPCVTYTTLTKFLQTLELDIKLTLTTVWGLTNAITFCKHKVIGQKCNIALCATPAVSILLKYTST